MRAYDEGVETVPIPGKQQRRWPSGVNVATFNKLVQSEIPTYAVTPVQPFPPTNRRTKYFRHAPCFTWENNFCFLLVLLDVVNSCLIHAIITRMDLELCGLPMWDQVVSVLMNRDSYKGGIRCIAHHLRHVIPVYEPGKFGGIDIVMEALTKDLVGFRTLPGVIDEIGVVSLAGCIPPHVVIGDVGCTSCNSNRSVACAYFLSDVLMAPYVGTSAYNPLQHCNLIAGASLTFRSSVLNGSIHRSTKCFACGMLDCVRFTIRQYPCILLVECIQCVYDDVPASGHAQNLSVARYVSPFPESGKRWEYELAAAVFHVNGSHFVGVACSPRERVKFRFIDGFGKCSPLTSEHGILVSYGGNGVCIDFLRTPYKSVFVSLFAYALHGKT